MSAKPRMVAARSTMRNFGSYERSSAVTPKYFSLIHAPIAGDMTPLARLAEPVKKANIVPSMPFGVILANSARIGRRHVA